MLYFIQNEKKMSIINFRKIIFKLYFGIINSWLSEYFKAVFTIPLIILKFNSLNRTKKSNKKGISFILSANKGITANNVFFLCRKTGEFFLFYSVFDFILKPQNPRKN